MKLFNFNIYEYDFRQIAEAINEQIVAEMWSANLYLSMSFYLQREGYDGCATWMKKQSQEELEHAYDMANYVIKRGGVAKVDKIDVVPQEWNGVLGVLRMCTSMNAKYPS